MKKVEKVQKAQDNLAKHTNLLLERICGVFATNEIGRLKYLTFRKRMRLGYLII